MGKYIYVGQPINPPKVDVKSLIYLVGKGIEEGEVLKTLLGMPYLLDSLNDESKELMGVKSLNRDITNPFANNVILSPGYAKDAHIEIPEGINNFLNKLRNYDVNDLVEIVAKSLEIDDLLVSTIGVLINGGPMSKILGISAFNMLIQDSPKLLIKVMLFLLISVYVKTNFSKENITYHDAQLILILDLCEMADIKEINIPEEDNPLLKDINLN